MLSKYIYILFIINFLIIGNIKSQNINTNSPYSRFGIGDIAPNVFGKNHAMGGTSIGMRDHLHINPNNPASYSSIDSTKVGSPFIFELGLSNKMTSLSTSENTYTDNNTNISYLSFGFPYLKNKWFGSFGLKPYSNVGYRILATENTSDIGNVEYFYNGSGGINKVFSGHSFKIGNFISLGFNANYLFGFLKQTNTIAFKDTSNTFNYQIEKSTRINDLFFNFGIQFHHTFTRNARDKSRINNHTFNLGFIFDNETNISAKRDILAGTTFGFDNESISLNSIIDTLINVRDSVGNITLPINIGFGLSYEYNNKLTLGFDYSMQNWSEATFFGANDSLANSNRTSFGIEYSPNKKNIQKGFSSFLKRVRYRAGVHYSNTYLQFIAKDEQIKEFGISFGLGIPVKKNRSMLNLFFEFKQRGTIEKDLIKEQYGIIGVNFTFYDIWFVKRKYN